MVILKVVVFEIEERHKNECELGVEVRNAGVKVIAGGCRVDRTTAASRLT